MNRFPVSVADSPLPGFRRYRKDRSTENKGLEMLHPCKLN